MAAHLPLPRDLVSLLLGVSSGRFDRRGVSLASALDEFSQVLAGLGDVFPQGRGCPLSVSRPADLEKFAMRLPCAVQITGKGQRQTGITVPGFEF